MQRRDFVRATAVAASAAAIRPESLLGWRARPADRVFRNGVVYDGTGAPPRRVDVAVAGDRIAEVGTGVSAAGAEVVDLRGMALAPGFIDIHSHTDTELLIDPRAESKVRQGVTTEVAGQDGGSIGPWDDEAFEENRRRYRERAGVEISFRDAPGFMDHIDAHGAAVNWASMVGQGSMRGYVVGQDDRPATDAEVERMRDLVRDHIRRGCCGLSTGLEYTPGGFADTAEIVRLAEVLQGTGLPYASHMRNEDDRVLGAIEEALNIGRLGGVPVEISHLKAQGQRNWWKAPQILELLEAARADGIDVMYDRYPYVAYSTGLSNLFPITSRDGGTDAFLARLRDPAQEPAIQRAVRAKIAQLGSWDAVQITSTGEDSLAWARGRRLGELAAERGKEPYAMLLELMFADRSRTGMVGFGMDEENTAAFLAHPLGMVCSDGGSYAIDGPLHTGSPHPRSYGTFPRVLGHYVRDRGDMPLETAIHKMTGQSARRLRFTGRGRVAAGYFADLVVFDPATVADRATFEDPHQYPVGIPHVVVNGEFVIRDGENTGATPGRSVRPA